MSKKILSFILLICGLLTGLLVIQQYNSYQKISRINVRDRSTNAFHEIKILQDNNHRLMEEIQTLQNQLQGYTDQANQSEELTKDIEKNKILAGEVGIVGPGIVIKIGSEIDLIWFVDLSNELFGAGAEALAVNGIRLTNDRIGFTSAGNQIALDGITLRPPFTIEAIGSSDVLQKAMEQGGSILKRLQAQYPEAVIELQSVSSIQMSPKDSV